MSWVQRARIAILFFCLGLFCLSQQPRAYWQSRDSNYNISVSGVASYVGPGDLTTFTAWWGLRAYSAAKRGTVALNACNTTGGVEVGCGDLSTDAATGNLVPGTVGGITCPGANCTVKTLYDQTGGGFNSTQATIARRPALTASCVGSLPCMTFSGGQGIANSTIGAIAQIYSITAVAKRTSIAATDCILCTNNANDDIAFHGSGLATMIWASAFVDAAAAENTWHSVSAVANGASSTLTIDGNSAVTGSPGAGSMNLDYTLGADSSIVSTDALNGTIAEAGVKSGDFTSVIAALNSNEKAYWGF